jgi:2-iminoacetate synthase
MDDGYIPSFCTACYRSGRTGDRFMSLAKSGKIKDVCLPNALMTLCEYAEDYGDAAFRTKSGAAIERNIPQINSDKIRLKTAANVDAIRQGRRDFYF